MMGFPIHKSHRFTIRLFVLLLGCLLLSGCIVPKTVANAEDERCQLVTREMTLEMLDGYSPVQCYGNEDCTAAAVFAVGVAVVSGSIVVVNNTVHWLEKQGRCGEPHETNIAAINDQGELGAIVQE